MNMLSIVNFPYEYAVVWMHVLVDFRDRDMQ